MKRNRKAMGPATLGLLILVVATALVMGGVVTLFSEAVTKEASKRACEFDINKAILSKKAPALGTKALPKGVRSTLLTNCRRDKLGNLVIEYDDVVDNGIINQDKAHKIIADEMADCWKMVGAGTKDPFSNWDGKGESYCMVCSTIKFDERLTKLYDKKVKQNEKGESVISEEDLKKYTIQPVHPYLMDEEIKDGSTYWDFLYNEKAIKTQESKVGDNIYSFIAPESTIVIQMYKLESKGWIPVGWIVGGTLIGIGIIATIPTAGASLTLAVIGAGGWIGGVVGVATVVHASFEAYKECEECNAIGGMQLIPPEQEFDIEMKVQLGEEGKEKQIPLCSIIVN